MLESILGSENTNITKLSMCIYRADIYSRLLKKKSKKDIVTSCEHHEENCISKAVWMRQGEQLASEENELYTQELAWVKALKTLGKLYFLTKKEQSHSGQARILLSKEAISKCNIHLSYPRKPGVKDCQDLRTCISILSEC